MVDFKICDMKKEIPIFFCTDDNYVPFLDVAITSIIENASKDYKYKFIVLHTGLEKENKDLVMKKNSDNVSIEFSDISSRLENVKEKFKDIYHFSLASYYRLFIASLFPQYDKIIYLDCDLVVTGDISKLYNTDLKENILAACPEEYVRNTDEFIVYAKNALGLDPATYINSGVLLISLDSFRKNKIEEQFIDLITTHDFDLIDPDQAYINYLCRGKIHLLPNGWNKEPMPVLCEGEKNIIHYALYKKPWQDDDVTDGEIFWHYAKKTPFYNLILERKASFGEKDRKQKEIMAKQIRAHAFNISKSEITFAKMLEF